MHYYVWWVDNNDYNVFDKFYDIFISQHDILQVSGHHMTQEDEQKKTYLSLWMRCKWDWGESCCPIYDE